ncbi:MAG TPA: pyrroloquinoline quinone-dependent dehydrogenase [Gemmatimonadales bacterium]
MKLVRRAMFLLTIGPAALAAQTSRTDQWPAYGNVGGTRFSPAAQITPANVGQLELAWIYRTGDYHRTRGRFEANPILVDGTLYLSTPLGRVVALDPATGAERWQTDERIDLSGDYGDLANRGVATWLDPSAEPGAPCRRTIYLGTVDARLIALDAATGTRCTGFGAGGVIDLSAGLHQQPAWHGEYAVTSPATVVGSLVIVGSSIADNNRTDTPEGAVRAFDARTGRLAWSFDPIPRSADSPVWSTWRDSSGVKTGAANAWTVFSADSALGLVYVPTGSASPDFVGGARLGQNLYANSLVALDAKTGRVAWYFQVVHHDLWDYDIPAQPALFTWRKNGRMVPAVAVATKMGHLFILDRRNGKPLVPVEERAVPKSDLPGEETWPTQPFPPAVYRLVPEVAPLVAFGRSDSTRNACAARIAQLRYQGIFTPQSLQGTINYPGHIGGVNWSGVAVDELRGLLIASVNNFPTVVRLIPRDSMAAERARSHGQEIGSQRGTPYGMMRTDLWPEHQLPCTPPPWGSLVAIDFTTDSLRWSVPLGTTPGAGTLPYGSISLGGAIVTGGGLVFIAASLDNHLRAFDERTGEVLWGMSLPAGGQALPMTYVAGGRQFVVISAGGHDRLRTPMGDYVVAYALPQAGRPALDTTYSVTSGNYVGEMRVGGARVGLGVTLRVARDSIGVTATGTDSIAVIAGTAARHDGRGVRLDIPFDYAAKHCAGVIHATLTPWNGGNLLEGDAEITGTCGGGPPEQGSVALRRR